MLYQEAVGNLNPETGQVDYFTIEKQILCEFAPRAGGGCEHYDRDGGRPNFFELLGVTSHGLLGKIPAIFVKVGNGNNFEEDYRWVRRVIKHDGGASVQLDNLDAFETARQVGVAIRTAQTASARADAYFVLMDTKNTEVQSDPVVSQAIKELVQVLWEAANTAKDTAAQNAQSEITHDTVNNGNNVSALNQFVDDVWVAAGTVKANVETLQGLGLLGITLECTDKVCISSAVAPDTTHWPAFKQRIAELNHKNATGSRSGDVLIVLDGERGYLTVNNQHEVYPGWHGGPTESESFVPLMFAMRGNDYVDSAGANIAYPSAFAQGYNNGINAANVNTDGYLRNWHLSPLLSQIMAQFRED